MASSGELIGWSAAFCSMLAFGSFGVPIKSKRAVSVDIDPLVFQSYKTIMCFLTSWLVLLAGVPFSFTPWGIVSGAFWVPGGVATVYAIKRAGLAIGIGVGSCFIVMVSFIWGIFIFDEEVHSKFGATFAMCCMAGGLFGMAYYSSPESETSASIGENQGLVPSAATTGPYVPIAARGEDEDDENIETGSDCLRAKQAIKTTDRTAQTSFSEFSECDDDDTHHSHQLSITREEVIQTSNQEREDNSGFSFPESRSAQVELFGGRLKITERNLGILAAALITGVWGGSILVPMKWCNSEDKGINYLISFAIGASIITISLWVLRFLYNTYYCGSFQKAYDSLPSFHLRLMWLPGSISGILWSIGNLFSMVSVKYLGEGVGYPLVQTSILVSGLWGIFYFKEITGARRISLWLCSSSLTIFGILLLSYEHVDHSKDN